MNQADRGSYRKKESIFTEFFNSCLGRAVIGLVFLAFLFIIGVITCPSEETMYEETRDNIRQCIQASDSLHIDGIDETLNNISYIFSSADTAFNDAEMMAAFDKYNRMEYYDHTLFSTMRLYNNFRVEGVRCAIGIFGMVIPTVSFNDFLLRVGPMRKEYNAPAINNNVNTNGGDDEDYFGDNPDLGGVFEYDED